jgi:diketogulonate reductase-like aldo/keto reductase
LRRFFQKAATFFFILMEEQMNLPTVLLPDGTRIPALGLGTWYMGESASRGAAETAVLREGIERGLSLIDTAEMYANGGAEKMVGEAIKGLRERVFLVSKIMPQNASSAGVARHCEASLKRLGTDYLDLYLLHWPGSYPLAQTVAAFEQLRAAGKIRHWGVSNFDTADMEELFATPQGKNCATNQVLYHPDERGIEFDLLPWSRGRNMPVMAYSPLGQAGRLLRSPALKAVAQRHAASPAQIAIAWSLRDGNTISIPKSANPEHLRENAQAAAIRLSEADLAEIDRAHKPPARKSSLAML